MKKRCGLAALIIATAMFTVACQNNSSSNTSTSSQSSKSSQVQKSKTSVKTNKKQEQSHSQSQAPQVSRLTQMNRQLKKVFPKTLLPQNDGLGQGSDKLNVRYSISNGENDIYYSVGNNALSFNNPAVKKELPFAVLSEMTNLNDSQADDLINFQADEQGLPQVKVDTDVTATQQSGAGQTYLNWVQGKWSFTVHANALAEQNPLPTAKQVVQLAKKYKLPETQTHGSMRIQVGYSYGSLENVITWKENGHVYQLRAHSLDTAFKMVSSMK
ncbi:hypothetical protein [Lactobacillus hominis]|uniref:Lipoprotein n=1 Tax=Lactobacillus hominis DSM 23910 = CRBIP 24.179 TaxID=1423758 RepID=I7L8Y4_9LACO|nr:hypothetical protein [Lactobacillus hominis]KRM86026.1 hypothetical protein FC41_GL000219 [Lactobacillus hominis DSM 23910 = CRBIP 24.179]MCT3348748.1 hypothetical protein [Lactobacillus hominis]CCI81019.1 Putative uncharacterized protein [Lactobacillus hominis DSM 23910 = CRBIP 24.179]